MKLIYKNLPAKSNNCYAVTVGVFDGVHLGHRYLLKKLKQIAVKKNYPCLAITFDCPPEVVLSQKKFGYLTDYHQKAALVKDLEIDFFWVLKADKRLFNLPAADFLDFIQKYFPVGVFLAGSDFHFGLKAKAGPKKLKRLSREQGFETKIITKKKLNNFIVSSSLIKKAIKDSDFKKVNKLLGRGYQIKGRVIKGRGIGKRLGFPTANLSTFGYFLPSSGVYAGLAKVKNKYFLAAINIGKLGFESHLINFSQNILNEIIEITFFEKLRPELKFQSQAKLIQFIKKDVQLITAKYSVTPS